MPITEEGLREFFAVARMDSYQREKLVSRFGDEFVRKNKTLFDLFTTNKRIAPLLSEQKKVLKLAEKPGAEFVHIDATTKHPTLYTKDSLEFVRVSIIRDALVKEGCDEFATSIPWSDKEFLPLVMLLNESPDEWKQWEHVFPLIPWKDGHFYTFSENFSFDADGFKVDEESSVGKESWGNVGLELLDCENEEFIGSLWIVHRMISDDKTVYAL